MKPMLNCWIVALWMWGSSRFRTALWIKRSQSFRGLVGHTGTIEQIKGRAFAVIQYIPRKQLLGTRRNLLVVFDGRYRVTVVRAQYTRTFDTLDELNGYLREIRG